MEEQTTQGIDLSVFLHNFRRTLQHFFWVPIVLGLLLGGVSWLRAARSYAPVYQSSAVFSVSAGFSSSTDILSHSTYLDSNAAAQLSATFPYVLQSDRMQLLLQQELGDQRAPVSLSASSVADAALFTLTATGSDPQAVYDTLLAAIETSSRRISSDTSSPLRNTCCVPSRYFSSRRTSPRRGSTAAASEVSTPARSIYRPMARYMAPVST